MRTLQLPFWSKRAGRREPSDEASRSTPDQRALPVRIATRGFGFVVLAFRGFLRDEGLHRASALAFDTALGIVPLLAFLVAVLKGLGGYDDLVTSTLRPMVEGTLGGMAGSPTEAVTLGSAFLALLDFVERTDFSALGALGLVSLLYVVVVLLVSIEASLNRIFGVSRPRSVLRRVSDYSAILFILPVCGMIAGGVASTARGVDWPAAGFLLQVLALVATSLGLAALYLVMPFTRVRLRSALLGGVVAGLLAYVTLLTHVKLQIGVARYDMIYSTFSAIPLLLIWVFVTWVGILFGAEVVAAHSDPEGFRWRVRAREVSHATREYAAVRAMVALAASFASGGTPPTVRELARGARLPPPLIESVLERLALRNLVTRAASSGEATYVPGRDLGSIRLSDIVEELETEAEELERAVRSPADAATTAALVRRRGASHDPECDPTLLELVEGSR